MAYTNHKYKPTLPHPIQIEYYYKDSELRRVNRKRIRGKAEDHKIEEDVVDTIVNEMNI